MGNLTVEAARLGRFVLSGYRGFVNTKYPGHTQLLSALDIQAPGSKIASRFVLCDPKNGGRGTQLEFRASVLPSTPRVLERAYPKYQNQNLWNKFILPYILDAIQDSNCLSAGDFKQLKEIVLGGKRYSDSALQLAMIIGDFYRAAVQVNKIPKNGRDIKLCKGIFDESINLNLCLNWTGKLEVQAKPLKNKTFSPPVKCTVMDFLPSSPSNYVESKHLFYLGCLDALSTFKLLLPNEEKELQELVLGETPFSRTALQVALLLNDAYSAFSKLSSSELNEIESRHELYLLTERLLDNLENSNCSNANLSLSINSGSLELRATPQNEETSVVVDVVPANEPALKRPNMKRSVLGFIIDGMENTELFERQAPALRALLLRA